MGDLDDIVVVPEDVQSIDELTGADVCRYLEENGWFRSYQDKHVRRYLKKGDSIDVPMDGLQGRIAEACTFIETLAQMLKRSPGSIMRELKNTRHKEE